LNGEKPYDVTVYEAILSPWWAETEAEAVAWPWSRTTVAGFEGDEYARYTGLTAEQTAEIVHVPNGGGHILVPVTNPTGEVLSLSVRPILPGGVTAADA
jgi:hypothetical protein